MPEASGKAGRGGEGGMVRNMTVEELRQEGPLIGTLTIGSTGVELSPRGNGGIYGYGNGEWPSKRLGRGKQDG